MISKQLKTYFLRLIKCFFTRKPNDNKQTQRKQIRTKM